MTNRSWAIATIVLGLASLAIVIGFSFLPEVQAAYAPGDFGPALGRFQRAWTEADLAAVFGDPADAAKLAAMTAGNRLDLYGFIPAYALFLIAATAMLAGGLRAPLAWLAIAASLIGAGADVLETSRQITMTTDYINAAALLPVAPYCWTKYFALAFGAFGMSALCFLSERKRWILGALGFAPLAATFADFATDQDFAPAMTLAFGGFWIALIVVGVIELVRKIQPR